MITWTSHSAFTTPMRNHIAPPSVVAVFAAVLLAGCGSDNSRNAGAGGGTVIVAQTGILVANIDSVSTPDSLTATVWFKKRSPEQFYDVAYQVFVLPEHVYGKVAAADMKTSDVLRHPVGTGRFRLTTWEAASRM